MNERQVEVFYNDLVFWEEYAAHPIKFSLARKHCAYLMGNPKKITAAHIEQFTNTYHVLWTDDTMFSFIKYS
jgi:hypothetical protein